jgi:hypothetical protein
MTDATSGSASTTADSTTDRERSEEPGPVITPTSGEGGVGGPASSLDVEPTDTEPTEDSAGAEPTPGTTDFENPPSAIGTETAADGASSTSGQTSLATAPATPRGLSYAVDIVFCVDVTGSMTPILDQVKANALRFYSDVQSNLSEKGKNIDELRVRIIAFRDILADGDAALQESPFFALPGDEVGFSEFVNGLVAEGGGDAPESGLEAVALAMTSPWTTSGDRRRQVVVVWTDQPAHPLDASSLPPTLAERVPGDFSSLTDLWEDPQGLLGSSSKRLILFAPDGPGWSDISSVWENVVHHPSQAGGGLSDVDYGTIIDSIGNSV